MRKPHFCVEIEKTVARDLFSNKWRDTVKTDKRQQQKGTEQRKQKTTNKTKSIMATHTPERNKEEIRNKK